MALFISWLLPTCVGPSCRRRDGGVSAQSPSITQLFLFLEIYIFQEDTQKTTHMLRFSPSVVLLDAVVALLRLPVRTALMRMSHTIRIVFVAIVVDGVEILFRHVCMMAKLITF